MKLRTLSLALSSFCYLSLTLQTALADDTEIYVSRSLPEDQQVRPNLMFVIDNSGSMDAGVPGTTCAVEDRNIRNRCLAVRVGRKCEWWGCQNIYEYRKTRLQVVKDVTSELIDELRGSDDVNIGLMHFDASRDLIRNNSYDMQGGMVAIPTERVSRNADAFKAELNRLYASSNTPLSEAYYEAALYMKGEQPKFGNNTKAAFESEDGGYRTDYPSVAASKSGSNYKSPIEYSCQKSNIILLTDGEPTMDNSANNDIRALIDRPGAANTQYTTGCRKPNSADGSSYSGECMPHLAEHLANQDISSQPGKQTVTTYTIGFATQQSLLENTAAAGTGRYFTTDNTSGLVSALKSILVEILAENTTFATPSVAVSAYNNLGYRNDLYYALFRPAEGARWVGNVKRYKLKPESIDISGNKVAAHIVDRNGQPAVDEGTGFFRENASSYWSNMDGRDVAKGGIAGMLADPSSRKIYTWTDADRSPTSSAGVAGNAALETLTTGNSTITNALMGVSSTAAKENAINWGRGIDPVTGQARQQLADVLHNEPRLVAYKTDEDLLRVEAAKNGTATSPEQLYMFFGTNEGFIHAVDPNTGIEQFAFIPKELLPNLDAYHRDPKGSDAKRYGMDGQFNLWVEYGSLNTTAKTRDITKSILYAGMRRGGRNYYALDVGNITSPTLKWVIKGGATPGFEKLGQTWSTPKLADIKVNGTKTKVLIFSGGYDPLQDDDSSNTPLANDNFGNSLYIVNAETGQLIWRAGHTTETGANLQLGEMTHSMPADPVVIDINGDGLADILYAADSRAQVFRFDINNANTGATNLATGGRIAALGGGTALDNRRFFSTPDVALIRERGGKTYFTIALGSGYRAHPLNEDTIDRFYVLRDANVFTKPGTYTTMTESDLVDVSSVNLTDEEASGILEQIAAKEAAINSLNQAVSDIRNRFEAYKNAEGFIAQYNAMLQANSYANDLQAQIDAIWLANPYLLAHASESSEQSKLQQGLLDIQKALKAMLDARTDAEGDLADKQATYDTALSNRSAAQAAYNTDRTPANLQALNDAEAAYSTAATARNEASDKKQALQTHTQTLGGAYHSLIALQGGLENLYQEVQGKEQELTDARSSNSDETRLADLERELNAANEQYANNALFSTRSTLNNGTETTANLQDALAALNAAISSSDTVDIQDSLAELEALTGPGSGPETIDELLARDEDGKNTALANHSANLTDNMALLDELDGQRLEQAGLASAARAEADLIADAEYRADSELLTAEQLAAAKALYGNDLTMFEAYQYLIDQAQLATLDETSGLPALRQDINSLYAQLTPGNNYVPNKTLLASSKGWFLRLPKGEKILSASLSFRGAVLFNTFSPRGESLINCGPDVGRGRAYALSLTDAGAIFTKNDVPIRSYALVRSGIPPSPSIVFDDDGTPNIVNGPEVGGPGGNPGGGNPDPRPDGCVPGAEFCKNPAPVSKTYWREN
ncbi:PilC/PilY family type IV pilus protein [Pseudomonas knackmussii]|uniref:PilC/PilY family type IV pilus protein n=1 Tax=Pseudomonas knackmussii TaxID=65741 RepID=A0ABY4KTD7_9PSED|nr:PilC/PilY family type IV pilus protein [Pseudomonas knackmussii]UPQ83456.1 PilC/PilY family type IV pilus protein [Pseudomonas knackmussii]